MALFTLNRNDLCLCGSRKKYKYCCLKFSELTLNDYFTEIDNGDYNLAYNIANSELTKYLLNIKRHTVLLLKDNDKLALPLLKIDVEAVNEFIEKMLFALSKGIINVDFISKVNFISSLVEHKIWKERMKAFNLVYCFIVNYNKERLENELYNVNVDEIEDTQLIQIILDIKSDELGIGQKIALLDKVIALEKDDFIKAKHQFQKALVYFLNNDNETGLRIANDVIDDLNHSTIKKDYHSHICAQAFSMYAEITSDKAYYDKAIKLYLEIMQDNNYTVSGKARNLIALGHTYSLMQDYENAEKYLTESKAVKYFYLADIYLAFVKINVEDFESAKKTLEQIIFEELDKENKFDYLVAYSLSIFGSGDIEQADIMSRHLKEISFENSYYFNNAKMELLLGLKDVSFVSIIRNENIRIKWLDKLNNAIMLQPNFFGIGLNINNIIDGFNKNKDSEG